MVIRTRNQYVVKCPRCQEVFTGQAENGWANCTVCLGLFQTEEKGIETGDPVSPEVDSTTQTGISRRIVVDNESDGRELFRLISMIRELLVRRVAFEIVLRYADSDIAGINHEPEPPERWPWEPPPPPWEPPPPEPPRPEEPWSPPRWEEDDSNLLLQSDNTNLSSTSYGQDTHQWVLGRGSDTNTIMDNRQRPLSAHRLVPPFAPNRMSMSSIINEDYNGPITSTFDGRTTSAGASLRASPAGVTSTPAPTPFMSSIPDVTRNSQARLLPHPSRITTRAPSEPQEDM